MVEQILQDLKLTDRPRVLALNKIDLMDPEADSTLPENDHGPVAVLTSTVTGAGLQELLQAVQKVIVDNAPARNGTIPSR